MTANTSFYAHLDKQKKLIYNLLFVISTSDSTVMCSAVQEMYSTIQVVYGTVVYRVLLVDFSACYCWVAYLLGTIYISFS